MDIIERLRSFGPDWSKRYNKGNKIPYEICVEAADEIERLRKERDNWQEMYLNMMTAAQRAGVLSE